MARERQPTGSPRIARRSVAPIAHGARQFAAEALKPKFSSKYLIEHVSSRLIPAVKEFEKQYQPPVTHLGRVLTVGDGIARVYGLKSVQVGALGPDAPMSGAVSS